LSSKEVTRQLPSILLEEKSNMEKILNLWDIATSSIVEYGPRVLSYVLQFDGKYYGAKHFFSKDPFWSVMKKLIKHAQLAGEINNLSDPEILFYIIHTFFVGNNLGWASCDGTYDYTTYIHIGIQYILGDIHIDHDSLDIHRNRIQELLDTSESGITIL
ncbi:MAG: hypothetical protein IJ337_09405, partial [Clostridia bacterium]|nr:hypothetical protein [Clostridia bacterium]